MTDFDSLLETYSISDLLELNDLTEAECLRFLVETEFLELPEITPLEFDD